MNLRAAQVVALGWIFCCNAASVRAQSVAPEIPPPPVWHFSDSSHTLSFKDVNALDDVLAKYERDTGNQFVVRMELHLPAHITLEEYATRVFNQWGIGQKGKNNGVLLLVFVADHKVRLETGLGMQKVLPDEVCADIIKRELAPFFKKGDYEAGLRAGIDAVIGATRGEYRVGQPAKEFWRNFEIGAAVGVFLLGLGLMFYFVHRSFIEPKAKDGNRRGFGRYASGVYAGSSQGGNGGSGGGGSSGGGFTGGGGSSGGGGASGGW